MPYDALFDMLPCTAAKQRSSPKPGQVAAALAAAAQEAEALASACGAGVVAESTLAATLLPSLAPGTCCRNKRSADVPAPATGLAGRDQRQHLQLLLGDCMAEAQATPGAATPATCTADVKRQRTAVLTEGHGAAAAATPAMGGSDVGSNSKVQPKAVRRVARDLAFTPAPPPRQPRSGEWHPGPLCLLLSPEVCRFTFAQHLHTLTSMHPGPARPHSGRRQPADCWVSIEVQRPAPRLSAQAWRGAEGCLQPAAGKACQQGLLRARPVRTSLPLGPNCHRALSLPCRAPPAAR